MWTERAKSWRKKGKRGVSPIIATILLVAITVVLAAVLYILISGLTKGPGTTPLGTAFAWGPESNVTVATGAAPTGCSAGHACYSLEVGSASSGLQTNGLTFSFRSSTGATVGTSIIATVTLVSPQGTSVSVWTASTNSWSAGNIALGAGQTMVVSCSSSGLLGDTVVAIGQGGFQGEVTSQTLN